MFFRKKTIVYPFSGFDGVIVYQGTPLKHTTVKRTYDWNGTIHEDITQTDENGRFHFSSVAIEARESLSQFVSSQSIFIYHEDNEIQIWSCGKILEDEFGEFGGKPENFTCDLGGEWQAVRLPYGIAGSLCNWTTSPPIDE